jgi:hypothetical protein
MVTHPKNLERERSVPEVYAEGLRYFMGEGTINKTLTRLASDLQQRGIDYMVIGAIALLAHGYPRFTEDIDLVMTSDGLQKFHDELVGLGYTPAFSGAKKRLRSTTDNVPIEVMTTGECRDPQRPQLKLMASGS